MEENRVMLSMSFTTVGCVLPPTLHVNNNPLKCHLLGSLQTAFVISDTRDCQQCRHNFVTA